MTINTNNPAAMIFPHSEFSSHLHPTTENLGNAVRSFKNLAPPYFNSIHETTPTPPQGDLENASFDELLFAAKSDFMGYMRTMTQKIADASYNPNKEKIIEDISEDIILTVKAIIDAGEERLFFTALQERYRTALRALHQASSFPGNPQLSIFSEDIDALMQWASQFPEAYCTHITSCLASDQPPEQRKKEIKKIARFTLYNSYHHSFSNSIITRHCCRALRVLAQINSKKLWCREISLPSEEDHGVRNPYKKRKLIKKLKNLTIGELYIWAENDFPSYLRELSICLHSEKYESSSRELKTIDIVRALHKKNDSPFVFTPYQKKYERELQVLHNTSIIPGTNISIFASKLEKLRRYAYENPIEYRRYLSSRIFSDHSEEKLLYLCRFILRTQSYEIFHEKYQKLRRYYKIIQIASEFLTKKELLEEKNFSLEELLQIPPQSIKQEEGHWAKEKKYQEGGYFPNTELYSQEVAASPPLPCPYPMTSFKSRPPTQVGKKLMERNHTEFTEEITDAMMEESVANLLEGIGLTEVKKQSGSKIKELEIQADKELYWD